MTSPQPYDALVIGAGVNGLTAAAYLARAGKHTLLVEARESVGGLCETADLGDGHLAPTVAHAFYALDPRVTSELKLTRHGLKFALRDATIALLRGGTDHLVLTRDVRASARNIAAVSKVDAEAWPRYRSELFSFARSMRTLWWEADGQYDHNDTAERIARTGSSAWLDSWFESDALKSLLAFDASALSPLDAGSALILAWRAAQEMCGLQASVALPAGGPGALVRALTDACKKAGVEIRTDAGAQGLSISNDRVSGVRLHSGEIIAAPLVLSSLSRRKTLLELASGAGLGLAERRIAAEALSPVAAAKIVLAFDKFPDAGGIAGIVKGRLILAERMESYVLAHAAARAGRIPAEPVMEVFFPTIADPSLAPSGGHVASVLVRPVPREIAGGWDAQKSAFAARIVASLNNHIPGLARHVVAAKVLTPNDLAARFNTEPDDLRVSRMLAGWAARMQTPIAGLFLCGAGADPVPAVSGRAGRIAASLAMRAGETR